MHWHRVCRHITLLLTRSHAHPRARTPIRTSPHTPRRVSLANAISSFPSFFFPNSLLIMCIAGLLLWLSSRAAFSGSYFSPAASTRDLSRSFRLNNGMVMALR